MPGQDGVRFGRPGDSSHPRSVVPRNRRRSPKPQYRTQLSALQLRTFLKAVGITETPDTQGFVRWTHGWSFRRSATAVTGGEIKIVEGGHSEKWELRVEEYGNGHLVRATSALTGVVRELGASASEILLGRTALDADGPSGPSPQIDL